MAMKKKTKAKTTKKRRAKKKTKKRSTSRWHLRQSFTIAVTKPAEVDKAVPEGFEVIHVEGLGVLRGKLWLHIDIVPMK